MRPLALLLLVPLLLLPVQPAWATPKANDPPGACAKCNPDDPPPPPIPLRDAAFVSQSVPAQMTAGKSYAVAVTMTNTGSTTWSTTSGFKLGSQNPQDNGTWGLTRVDVGAAVATDQSRTFSFQVTAPTTAGSYNFQWRMLQEGVAWFGASTPNVAVTVAPAPSNAPPTVSLTSPANGAQIQAPTALMFAATAADANGSIASVRFLANGVVLGTDTSSPYSWTSSLAAGSYQIRADATDNDGATTSSAPVTVTVTAAQTSQVSATRTYVYDSHQRLCKTLNPESGATVVDYDLAGNVAWSAEGLNLPSTTACDRELVTAGAKVVRTYDKQSRLVAVATPGATADLQQAYFANGSVKSLTVQNPGSHPVTTTYSYNHRGLLTAETSANGSTLFGLLYGYDANGNLASLTYPDSHVVNFTPDAFGRATRVAGNDGAVYARDIKYNPQGAIAEFFYGNGIKHVREGNLRQLPARSLDSYWNGSTEIKVLDDRYTFDANGNVTDITDAAQNGLTTRGMGFDGLDRLVAAISPLQWGNATYAYDALDNLRVADQGTRQYRYNYDDATNRLASIKSPAGATLITLGYDTHGNTVSKNGQALVFDAVNRMGQVTGKETYRYDGQGRRVQTTDADGKTTFWIYSQSGQVVYTSEARRNQNLAYIYLGNTQVATRSIAWDSGDATVRYQHTDSLGSPVAETDALGNIVKRNSYTPYGETFGTTVIDGTGYTGHVMDRATGLTYMQQRYYDPQTARFLSGDPVAVDLSTASNFGRYVYANDGPLRFADPDGRDAWETIRGFISPTGEQLATRGEPGTLSTNSLGAAKQLLNTAVAIAAYSHGSIPQSIPIANDELEGAAATELALGVASAFAFGGARPQPVGPSLSPGMKIFGSYGGPGAGKRFSPLTRGAAEAQAGGRCVFCGVRTTRKPGPTQRNTDHSHPKSQGGDNTLENAQNTCRRCNLSKGTMTTMQYLVKIGVILE